MNRAVFWSALERALPRAASAVILLLFAALVVPDAVGVYSIALLAVTFLQSAFELSMRQFAVGLVRSESGLRIIRRFQVVYLTSGVVLVLGVLAVLELIGAAPTVWIASLLPLILVPGLGALAIRAVAELQRSGRWRLLAQLQTGAAAVGLGVGVPVVLVTGSPLGPALFAATSEGVFAILAVRFASRLPRSELDSSGDGARTLRGFVAVGASSVLTWVQLNLDRLLIALLAGPAVLGLYTLAWSLSRSGADAVSAASSNVLRPQLFEASEVGRSGAERMAMEHVIKNAATLVFLGGAVVSIVALTILPQILGQEWQGAIDAIPAMVSPTVLALLEALLVVVLVTRGQGARLLPVRGAAILLALPVALAATVSIESAAWVMVARQALTLVLMLILTWGAVSVRVIALVVAYFAVLLGIAVLPVIL